MNQCGSKENSLDRFLRVHSKCPGKASLSVPAAVPGLEPKAAGIQMRQFTVFSSPLAITDVDSHTVVCENSKSKLFYFVITNIPRLTIILNIAPPLFLVNEDVSKTGSVSFIMLYHIYFLCQIVEEEAASINPYPANV